MKRSFEPYELSRTEIQTLRVLAQSSGSLSELAELIGKSPPLAKKVAENLVSKGLADIERKANRRIVRLSPTKHAQTLREIFLVYPHISWEDILSFSGILPLLRLEEAAPTRTSRTTEWRALRKMMTHGIVIKDGEGFKVNPRFQKVQEFIHEFQTYNNSKLATLASRAAVIVWSRGAEFIIRVPRGTRISDRRFQPTATTVLPKYGIPLITSLGYYFFSPLPRRLAPEDIVLHTLLTDGVANTTYALILIMKTCQDPRRLTSLAENYRLRDRVEEMLQFLETHKPQPGAILPSWDELAEKARDYGVTV